MKTSIKYIIETNCHINYTDDILRTGWDMSRCLHTIHLSEDIVFGWLLIGHEVWGSTIRPVTIKVLPYLIGHYVDIVTGGTRRWTLSCSTDGQHVCICIVDVGINTKYIHFPFLLPLHKCIYSTFFQNRQLCTYTQGVTSIWTSLIPIYIYC